MELRDYLSVIRNRKWIIIQAVVIVTLTAVAMSMIQPPRYQGEAKVLVSQQDTGAALLGTQISDFSGQPERGLQTQVQLMQLRPLAENTVRRLGLEMSASALLSRVEVSAVGETNVVIVRATAGDAEQAVAIANTMAEEYVVWSRDTKRESIRAAADEVQSRLDEAEAEVVALGKRIAAEEATDELKAELSLLTNTYATLAEQLEQLRISEQLETGSGRVVESAVASFDPVSPNPTRDGLLGLAVGLALGTGMAFLYEFLDDTVKSNDEAEKVFGVPVLGTIPFEKVEKSGKRRLTIVETPGSSAAEAYRVLRNSLDFINFEHQIKTLVIASAAPAEGKSTVAANLAASLSQAGKKVVLISCDFRRPTTEQFFAVENTLGLSDVLIGTHSLKAALQRPGDDTLLVLTPGKMPPNPSELLGSSKMKALVEELEEWADWVLIDTPPLLAVADTSAVARWADGVLLVIQAGKSTRQASKKARELVEMVGARLAGVAVWGLDESRSGGYGYGYAHYAAGYYYSSYYSEPTKSRTRRSKKTDSTSDWTPEPSPGRKIAAFLGRFLGGVLGFLIVVAILIVVVYFVDNAFGLGILDAVGAFF